jgi:hypothetical protein
MMSMEAWHVVVNSLRVGVLNEMFAYVARIASLSFDPLKI